MLHALLLSMAMFAPLAVVQGQTPAQLPAIATATDTAPAERNSAPAVSADARRYPDALAKFIQNGMNEPVPIATHDLHLGMHNLFFQKVDVVMDAGIGYNTATGMIDIVDGNGEVLRHERSFNPYSILWFVAISILLLPALNQPYPTGQRLGTIWGAAMIPTILAAIDCFVTFLNAETSANTGYLVATALVSFAAASGGTAWAAAEKNEAAWPYAGTYGALMVCALIAFVVPY